MDWRGLMAETYGEQLRRRDEAAASQQRVTAEEARATQVERDRNYRRKLAEDRNWRFRNKKDYDAWVLRAELPSYIKVPANLPRKPPPLTVRAAERTAATADAGDREGRVGLAKTESMASARAAATAAQAASTSDPFAGKTKGQIRTMQRQLGFTGRDVDGIAGPKTRAAWRARQGAADTGNILGAAPASVAGPVAATGVPDDVAGLQRQLAGAGFNPGPIDGIYGPRTRAAHNAWLAAGSPAGAGGGIPASAPAVASAPAPASVSDIEIQQRFPQLAMFLRIPEVGGILRDAVNEGWPPEKLAARVQNTEWWRTTPARTRAWMGLQAVDPATTQRQVDELASKFSQRAREYFLNLPQVTTSMWATKVLSGEVEEDGFEKYLKEMGKSMNPALVNAIDRGITPNQYAEPYRQTAAALLEIAPDQIDFSQPRWQRAVMHMNPKGETMAMTLADWQSLLRSDPSYGYDQTRQARAEAARFAEQLAQRFGKVA